MAITYPLDFLDDLPGWSTTFELMYRQDFSRHASGRTRVKDFGTPIWTATYVTKNLRPNQMDEWRARLNSLEGGLKTFLAFPKSRCWPILHPNGTGITGTGKINALNVNNKALSLKDVMGLSLSVGDFISVNRILYQVMEKAVANGSGITPEFEVRPQLSSSSEVDDTVNIYQPSCIMTLVPNSVSTSTGLNGRGSVSFQGIEARG